MEEVISDRVFPFACEARPSKLRELGTAQIRQIKLYSEYYCIPWNNTWAKELRPCEGLFAPEWCKSNSEVLIGKHLRIKPYFESLTAAVRGSKDSLERFNIMAVMAYRLGSKQLRDYPKLDLEQWVSEATSAFLEDAQPEDALGIGWLLYIKPFGTYPTLGQSFRFYIDASPRLTAEQRRLLSEVSNALAGGSISSETYSLLNERYGHREPLPVPPPTDRTEPEEITLLVRRVNIFYRLMKDRKFDESWDLVALDFSEGYRKEDYIRSKKEIWSGREILEWRVQRILVSGNIASVILNVRRQERRGNDSDIEEPSFWVFEGDTWNHTVVWPSNWNESAAVEVPVPGAPVQVQ